MIFTFREGDFIPKIEIIGDILPEDVTKIRVGIGPAYGEKTFKIGEELKRKQLKAQGEANDNH